MIQLQKRSPTVATTATIPYKRIRDKSQAMRKFSILLHIDPPRRVRFSYCCYTQLILTIELGNICINLAQQFLELINSMLQTPNIFFAWIESLHRVRCARAILLETCNDRKNFVVLSLNDASRELLTLANFNSDLHSVSSACDGGGSPKIFADSVSIVDSRSKHCIFKSQSSIWW